MPRQMVFEEFMGRPPEAVAGTLPRVPREKRDKLVGLLAELMSRAVAAEHCPPPTDDQPQTLLMRREVADHE